MTMSLKDRVAQAAGAAEEPQPEQTSTDIATRDDRLKWLNGHRTYFTDALPRHVDKAHFTAVALAQLPKLKNCTNQSIMTALLACARFGLEPDGRQAAIVPYKNTATFQPMYEGYIELMYRHPRVDSVHFNWIREKDAWDYTPSEPSPRDFYHKPRVDLSEEERGPVILAYAFAWIDGRRSQVIILNRSQAEKIRDKYSKSYAKAEREGSKDSTWHTDFDAMWAKSGVRRLVKVVPTSTELTELLQADDDADDLSTAPAVIRGTVVVREDQPDEGEQDTPAADWPQTAQPGSAAPEGDDSEAGDEG
ncbi:recombinase RecT [Streptomyces sp. NPDC005708]|uniref:recombinase RecT n=1 Tax=Streptomyces sp. NPDC005708 TaxID=3154564 RepID=UPI0033D33D2B